MSKYYVIDEIGNRQEALTKDQIYELFNTGEPDRAVYTDAITYNDEKISFEYTGNKPSEDDIKALLDASLDFNLSLIPSKVNKLLRSGEFKLHIFLCEVDIYITNGHCDVINIFNSVLGYRRIYVNSAENTYYMQANRPINNIYYCTKKEFNNIADKSEDTLYVVEDEEFAIESTKNVSETIAKMPLSSIFTNYDSSNKELMSVMVKQAAYATTAGTSSFATSSDKANDVGKTIGGLALGNIFKNVTDNKLSDGVVLNSVDSVTAQKVKALVNQTKDIVVAPSGTSSSYVVVEVLPKGSLEIEEGKSYLLVCRFKIYDGELGYTYYTNVTVPIYYEPTNPGPDYMFTQTDFLIRYNRVQNGNAQTIDINMVASICSNGKVDMTLHYKQGNIYTTATLTNIKVIDIV